MTSHRPAWSASDGASTRFSRTTRAPLPGSSVAVSGPSTVDSAKEQHDDHPGRYRIETPQPDRGTHPTSTNETGRTAAIGGAVSDAAATARDVAADAAGRLPDAAASARSAIEDANRQMRGGSDEMLTVGSALSLGLAGGLLIAGAPRLIVAGAMVPGVMMVLTVFNRTSRAPGTAGRSMQGR